MIDWHVQSEDSQYTVNLVYRFVPLNIDSLQVLTRYLTGIRSLPGGWPVTDKCR